MYKMKKIIKSWGKGGVFFVGCMVNIETVK